MRAVSVGHVALRHPEAIRRPLPSPPFGGRGRRVAQRLRPPKRSCPQAGEGVLPRFSMQGTTEVKSSPDAAVCACVLAANLGSLRGGYRVLSASGVDVFPVVLEIVPVAFASLGRDFCFRGAKAWRFSRSTVRNGRISAKGSLKGVMLVELLKGVQLVPIRPFSNAWHGTVISSSSRSVKTRSPRSAGSGPRMGSVRTFTGHKTGIIQPSASRLGCPWPTILPWGVTLNPLTEITRARTPASPTGKIKRSNSRSIHPFPIKRPGLRYSTNSPPS